MQKPKVAFFDFTSCEGCQLQMVNFGEELLEILKLVDLVEFREVISEKSDTYDIAIIEGSITTHKGIERVKKIRSTAKIVIAYGACATIGGINGMKDRFNLDEVKKYVYHDSADHFKTLPTRPLDEVIKVDYFVHNCPVYPPEVARVLKAAILGLPYDPPDYAVCVECKLNENECMYDKGIACLGPVVRGGCNAWCINNGNLCYGCRGMVSNPALKGQKDVLEKYKISPEEIINKIDLYNKPRELKERKDDAPEHKS